MIWIYGGAYLGPQPYERGPWGWRAPSVPQWPRTDYLVIPWHPAPTPTSSYRLMECRTWLCSVLKRSKKPLPRFTKKRKKIHFLPAKRAENPRSACYFAGSFEFVNLVTGIWCWRQPAKMMSLYRTIKGGTHKRTRDRRYENSLEFGQVHFVLHLEMIISRISLLLPLERWFLLIKGE